MILPPGTSLQNGKYIIGSHLAQGGFGNAYKARHKHMDCDVVIKTPIEHLKYKKDYKKYVERFIKEGKILANLSRKRHPHPNIVQILDLFEEDDTHYMVMDFVPGENLFDLVKSKGAISEAKILPIIRQIADALSAMHKENLVHRDAHPGNIIVEKKTGRATLIDFGLTKELFPSIKSAVENAGNVNFAPYEQICGQSSREPSVDVYCLAATLYYAVMGKLPTSSLDRKENGIELKPPKHLKPAISDALNQAIIKGMAVEAIDRPQSIQAWLKLLEAPSSAPRWQWLPKLINTQPHKTVSPPSINTPTQIRSFTRFLGVTPQRGNVSIPWNLLVISFVGYTVSGTILSLANAPFSALSWALALVAARYAAWAWAWAWAGVGAWTLTWAWAWNWAWVWVGILALTLARVLALVGADLSMSFNRSQVLVIVGGVFAGGMGLGWLIGAGLRLIGVEIPLE